MHKLAGLRRGDTIVLSKENLPGAVLFPAIVCEPIVGASSVPTPALATATATALTESNSATATATDAKSEAIEPSSSTDTPSNSDSINVPTSTPASTVPTPTTSAQAVPEVFMEHRFLAVTRERFLVLDSTGKGVGNMAVVKSNNHLTEVSKSILFYFIHVFYNMYLYFILLS